MGSLKSDTTERLHFHFSLSCTGEGNGNPLQCSCLENPRDGGTWWAAVSGVAQSRTQLKRLSSSSSSSSRVQLFATPRTVPHHAPLSLGLSRQASGSGISSPPSRDLPDPGIEPASPALTGRFFTAEPPARPTLVKEDETWLMFLTFSSWFEEASFEEGTLDGSAESSLDFRPRLG